MTPLDQPNIICQGYRLINFVAIPELKSTLREFIHESSGALIVHIEADDPENVFTLSFQTLPSTSNGVAHILEHTVLCGSKKYPIKDPFFSMQKRSLNTYMNALTGSDFTCYPAATQVKEDFYNLLDVYIDAVFFPLIKEKSFKQEGHRLEFEDFEDSNSPLVYRGIVYNEMQGAMNSASSRIHEALFAALFPDITYGVNSGGDPALIPTLTHEELLEFHKNHYHPSRCLFFFYGNFPLEEMLSYLDTRLLSQTESLPPLSPIPRQKRFTEPRAIKASYPIVATDSTEEKTWIALGWLTCYSSDQNTCLALSILEVLILDTDASPLKKILMKSGLCKQISSYIDTENTEVPFTIQLKGCEAKDADAIEKLIKDTLKQIYDKGFVDEDIENVIHQFEFHRSEISGDYYPFGLNLFLRAGLLRQHGGSTEQGLVIHSICDYIRAEYRSNPRLFQDLIKTYLLDNSHFVRVVMEPDTQLEQREKLNERERLNQIAATLSPSDKFNLVKEAQELKKFQQEQEDDDLNILPKIHLKDVGNDTQDFILNKELIGGLKVYHHSCFTNKIGYADLFFDLPNLSIDELKLLRLLTILLPQIGVGDRNYEQNLDFIQAHTGGISSYLTLHIQADNPENCIPALAIRGKSLYRKHDKLFPLLRDSVQSPNFSDQSRLKEIITKHYSNLESTISQNALKYALNISASFLDTPSALASIWYGIDYYHYIKEIYQNFDTRIEQLSLDLSALMFKITKSANPHLILSMDEDEYQFLKKESFFNLTDISPVLKEHEPSSYHIPLEPPKDQARIIASSVAFTAKAFNTISYIHPDSSTLSLIACLMDNLTLHSKIREEGGAYGGGAVSNALSGNFYFYSYRDPVIAPTLKAFQEAIEEIKNEEFDEEDIESAKLEMIQHLDSPVSPGSRAVVAYNWMREGRTPAVRQKFRNQLLNCTTADILKANAQHIERNFSKGATVVFAGQDLLEKENQLLPTPLPLLSI